jgi:hypothetical protein
MTEDNDKLQTKKRRNKGRPLKRLLDGWDRNGSTNGPIPWKIDDGDADDEELIFRIKKINGAVFFF